LRGSPPSHYIKRPKDEITLIRRGGLTPFGLSPKTKRKDEIASSQFEEVKRPSSILHPKDFNNEIASLRSQ
jgi:hypothetical protein